MCLMWWIENCGFCDGLRLVAFMVSLVVGSLTDARAAGALIGPCMSVLTVAIFMGC